MKVVCVGEIGHTWVKGVSHTRVKVVWGGEGEGTYTVEGGVWVGGGGNIHG